jgi:hypothetical protein
VSGPGLYTQWVPAALVGLDEATHVRHTRRGLDCEGFLAELGDEWDWRSGEVGGWSVAAHSRKWGRSWWRSARSAEALGDQAVVSIAGRVVRVDLDRVRHQRDAPDERLYIQLLTGAVRDMGAHHAWSTVTTDVFRRLVRLAGADGRIEATSLTALARACHVGFGLAKAVLAELVASDVADAVFCRGHRVDIVIRGRAAVIRPVAAPPPRRKDRRAGAAPQGPAHQGAERIWSHFGLDGLPAPGLVSAMCTAVRDGAPAQGLVERVVAGGGLGGLRDVTAGLVARVRQAADAYAGAAEEARRVAERRRADAEAFAAREAAEADAQASVMADSCWVYQVLGPEAIRTVAEAYRHLAGRPAPVHLVAAQVLEWARRTVAASPDTAPELALAGGLGREPPPGPAPPIGVVVTGPSILDALTGS